MITSVLASSLLLCKCIFTSLLLRTYTFHRPARCMGQEVWYSRHVSLPMLSLVRLLFQHCELVKAEPSQAILENVKLRTLNENLLKASMHLCRQAWKGCASSKSSRTLHTFSAPHISCSQTGHANLSPPTNEFLLNWFVAKHVSKVINAK